MNMKVILASVLLFGVISSTLAADCKWSYCAGRLIKGQNTCNEYGPGHVYSGKVRKADCKWDSEQVECCTASQGGQCKWTTTCWGMAYGGKWACSKNFGGSFIPNGETDQDNCGYSLKRHKCCN